MNNSDYLNHLDRIATEDVDGLKRAQVSYGDSWKRRGGIGAFMMLARKWDRIEKALEPPGSPIPYDIFAAIQSDKRAEGIIDDVRDLRRYLMLVEAEMRAQGSVSANSQHRDNDASLDKPKPSSLEEVFPHLPRDRVRPEA